jgi:FkbM family methyltransferase
MINPGIDFSQYGQPYFFRQFVPPRIPTWVVDVGAFDGIDGSNSREFLIQGWSGILIEPLPEVFQTLKQNCNGMVNVQLVSCACSDYEGTGVFYIGSDGPNGQSSSLCDEDGWRHNHGGKELSVKVSRLTTVLERSGCPRNFAVLLIDAEGMDLEVLLGLDFAKFRPAVICTEMYLANPEKDKRKHDLLVSQGYELRGSLGSDTIWTCTRMVGKNSWPDANPLYRGIALPPEIESMTNAGPGVVWLDNLIQVPGVVTVSGWAVAPDNTVPELVLVGLERDGGRIEYFKDEAFFFTGFTATWEIGAWPEVLKFKVVQCSESTVYENLLEIPVAKP